MEQGSPETPQKVSNPAKKCVGCADLFMPQQEAQRRCAKCISVILTSLRDMPTLAIVAALEVAAGQPGWRQAVTPVDLVQTLNELLQADPAGTTALMELRAPVSEAVFNHPTIKTLVEHGQAYTTPLGLLNGLLGARDIGGHAYGAIAKTVNKDGSGGILEFVLVREGDDGIAEAERVAPQNEVGGSPSDSS